jgi:hypothetical protein
MIDCTDLLRGICDAQLSSDDAALATVLREAAEPDNAGTECRCGSAKGQIRRPERGREFRAARLPKFGAERAWR